MSIRSIALISYLLLPLSAFSSTAIKLPLLISTAKIGESILVNMVPLQSVLSRSRVWKISCIYSISASYSGQVAIVKPQLMSYNFTDITRSLSNWSIPMVNGNLIWKSIPIKTMTFIYRPACNNLPWHLSFANTGMSDPVGIMMNWCIASAI